MSAGKTIVWFRQDLRLNDNPALIWAVEQGHIIPVYIVDNVTPDRVELGGASQWWLHHSLVALNKSLDKRLHIYVGDPQKILLSLIQETGAKAVVWNRCYQPWQRSRDETIKSEIKSTGIEVHSFNGSLLWEPMKITKQDGGVYKVFTPYYRKGCLNATAPRYPTSRPDNMRYASSPAGSTSIDDLALLPSIKWDEAFYAHWTPGEKGAAEKLQSFIANAALSYKSDRDIPSVVGTSKLSTHLRFGEISPNQIWYALLDQFGGADNEHIDTYLSELGWREFSYYLLYHWPSIPTENFNDKFNRFPWNNNDADLKAWQKGLTGIPFVDAGMRELWQTGYMHNRVRMVVGSFLVKNLLVDWRKGERWFWDCLLDADLASNSASWQWVAGSGADAAPYFRIFNPVLQGEKFDKHGEYVKTYCPELSKLPAKYIHKPWEAPSEVLRAAGIVLGKDYPKPIVDLKASRQKALQAYDVVKAG
ncbi:cryptochrome/photolyase family protein [Alteromonas facilis]|uniref:cryptochrome/photolyase family protein n=1 Tax=Alteromonas facilis TaxID=2048004 RepID=UPI000C288528|nr:deoxyribodipyrimidine photo-lyase [Alteromonas facilis]